MSEKSNIQWCDATWNVARGCKKVDEDCKFCYMYRDSFDATRYNPLDVVRTKTVFTAPLKYKVKESLCWGGRPLVFTCSLTDFFIEDIDPYRDEAWDIIRKCPHLIFQILTKRPERITDHLPADWGDGWDNVWLGTSIGSSKSMERLHALSKVKCKTRFLSLEPLWGEVDLPWGNGVPIGMDDEFELWWSDIIHWVIVGGESGNETGKYRYRPCELSWIESVVNKCKNEKVPVFVKQMGTHLSKELGMTDRHGGNINEFPEHLQVREFPNP